MGFEVSPDLRFVEARDAQRHVIDVPPGGPGRGSPELAERSRHIDENDQSGAYTKLNKTERPEAEFLTTAEHFAVEAQRPIEVRDAQDDVINADDVDRTHARDGTPRPRTCDRAMNFTDLTGAGRARTMRGPLRSQ